MLRRQQVARNSRHRLSACLPLSPYGKGPLRAKGSGDDRLFLVQDIAKSSKKNATKSIESIK